MSKRKAERALEQEVYFEDNTFEVDRAAAIDTHQTVSIRAEPSTEGATMEAPATIAASPTGHVDCVGADLFWMLLENARYTVW